MVVVDRRLLDAALLEHVPFELRKSVGSRIATILASQPSVREAWCQAAQVTTILGADSTPVDVHAERVLLALK